MNNINPLNFISQLQQFAKTIQGDPKQQVEQLVASGQMSQETYSQYSRVADAFSSGNTNGAMSMIFGNNK